MADWAAALLDAANVSEARLIGHSMGSLIALDAAARHPKRVTALSLIGTAAAMTVGPDLLNAAEANDLAAIDMVSIWGLGYSAELGGSLAPGVWMHGGAQAILRRCQPGVLFNDLAACNSYQNALAAAAIVSAPTTLILGERDMMTPARAGKALAAAIPHSRTIVLPGAGHMLMNEHPDELLAALKS
jgi:pimeloyl-ACP methyl ester carboxylesterase